MTIIKFYNHGWLLKFLQYIRPAFNKYVCDILFLSMKVNCFQDSASDTPIGSVSTAAEVGGN